MAMHGETRTYEAGESTPVLIAGVQRHYAIGLTMEPSDKLPNIYGRAFGSAPEASICRVTQRLVPPTVSDIVAMAAPSCGSGTYDPQVIELVLCTARGAAVSETRRLAGAGSRTVTHTGHWGCGAFGGNRELMATLQNLAAALTSCDAMVFHAGDAKGVLDFQRSERLVHGLRIVFDKGSMREVIHRLAEMKFHWGVSDGN